MNAPQVILIASLSSGVAISAIKHGELKEISLFYSLSRVVFLVALLWWGGFWK
jgi:hypothetical protein